MFQAAKNYNESVLKSTGTIREACVVRGWGFAEAATGSRLRFPRRQFFEQTAQVCYKTTGQTCTLTEQGHKSTKAGEFTRYRYLRAKAGGIYESERLCYDWRSITYVSLVLFLINSRLFFLLKPLIFNIYFGYRPCSLPQMKGSQIYSCKSFLFFQPYFQSSVPFREAQINWGWPPPTWTAPKEKKLYTRSVSWHNR